MGHLMNKILILGDIHFPFHNKKALAKVLSEVKRIKPTHVVQIGDLYDQYSFSRFTRKNLQTPEEELRESRNAGISLWNSVHKNAPNAKRYQILGNHDVRLIKRAEEKIPEAQTLIRKSVYELYKFKGVKTIYDDRQELVIGDVTFIHGYRSKLGDHMRFNRSNTVVGHSHTGGVVFEQQAGRIIWELNAGYLADETAEPLRYRPQTTSKWTLGYGLVDEKGPRFIAL